MLINLGIVDAIVLVAAVLTAIMIGLRATGKTHSVEAFLLGDRDLPWWAILGSIVATETSTATVLSLPGQAYGPTGMRFLQIAMGYILGRTIVVRYLLPLFFEGKLFSAYQVLDKRFGSLTKSTASLLFLVTRNLGDGLRLFLAALVLQKLVGWPFWSSAVAIGAITIIYTYFGGMRSVVWNDCIQLVIYMTGGVATIFIITANIPGGWSEFWEFSRDNGKLTVLQFWPPESDEPAVSMLHWLITDPFSFWAGIIGGAVLTLGTHGTDQMMVQRYLSARSQQDAGRALFLSGIVVFFQFALFLLIGLLLACFYAHQPDVTFERADEVYAHFIIESFPKNTGLVGLMLAAILAAAMSTLSSSLNSSASAVLNDFYLPRRRGALEPEALLKLTRRLAVGFGVLQIGIGIWATTFDATVVSNALTIAGYSAGLLLGLFGLGVLSRTVTQSSALTGAASGLLVLLFVQFILPRITSDEIRVAWPWYALLGSATTILVGFTCSEASRRWPVRKSS
jgi:SSS family solute:Na+ symporter